MKKKTAGCLVLLFAMMMTLTGCSGSGALDNKAEVINVDGVSVPMGELNFYLRYQQTQMQNFYGAYFGEDFMNQDLMGTGVPYGETVRDMAVDTLKEYYVVEAHAGELGISLTDEEKTAAADAAKAFIGANDKKALTAMSADEATVTHVLELVALQNKVYEDRAATIDTEVDTEEIAQKRISYVMTSTVGSSDADGNVIELTEEELAEKKSMMEEILAEAKESSDLSAAAESHELSATSVTYGKDDSTLNDAVREAADALADGEFSGVIEAESGYYVVYMESTYDEDATENERQSVLSERERAAYDAWYSPLSEVAEITTDDEAIQTLTFERVFNVPTEQ